MKACLVLKIDSQLAPVGSQGGAITGGLKKVSKDQMTHKNAALRNTSVRPHRARLDHPRVRWVPVATTAVNVHRCLADRCRLYCVAAGLRERASLTRCRNPPTPRLCATHPPTCLPPGGQGRCNQKSPSKKSKSTFYNCKEKQINWRIPCTRMSVIIMPWPVSCNTCFEHQVTPTWA